MICGRCWDVMGTRRCTRRTSMLSRGEGRSFTERIVNFQSVIHHGFRCSPVYVQKRQVLWITAKFFVKSCQTLSRSRSISRRTAITHELSVKLPMALLPTATLGAFQTGHPDIGHPTENRFGKHWTLTTMNSAMDRLQNMPLKF